MFTGFNLRKLIVCTLAFVFAVALGLAVYQGGADVIDQSAQESIFGEARTGLVAGMYELLAHLGDWYVVTGLCILLLAFKETRFAYGFPVALCSLLSVPFQLIIKHKLLRPRPDSSLWLINVHSQYSFPSGHALASALFLGMLAKIIYYYATNDGKTLHFYATPHPPKKYIKKANMTLVAVFACVLAIWMIGFARVYVGVHWMTDVLESWLIAIFILSIM